MGLIQTAPLPAMKPPNAEKRMGRTPFPQGWRTEASSPAQERMDSQESSPASA